MPHVFILETISFDCIQCFFSLWVKFKEITVFEKSKLELHDLSKNQ